MQETIENYIQIGLIFCQGYLLSRMFSFSGLAEYLTILLLKRSHGRLFLVFLFLTLVAGIISTFVSNIIATIALLPIITSINRGIKNTSLEDTKIVSTLLYFFAMVGANTGSLGSISGSPLNILTITYINTKHLPYAHDISYFTWLLWGMPLLFIVCSLIVSLVWFIILPNRIRKMKLFVNELELKRNYKVNVGVYFTIITLSLWLFIAIIAEFHIFAFVSLILSFLHLFWMIFFLFIIRYKHENNELKPLMKTSELFDGLPVGGFILLIITSAVGVMLNNLPLLKTYFTELFGNISNFSLLFAHFVFPLLVIFVSELLGNIVSLGLVMLIVLPIAQNLDSMTLALAVGLAASMPSMSPIGTGVNAIIFGSGRKFINFKFFLLAGFLVDILVGLFIGSFCYFAVHGVYSLLFS